MPGAAPSPLAAREVSRRFAGRGAADPGVLAVDRVSLDLAPGRTLGLVGESGSGKSTLGRLMVGLERPDQGEIQWEGRSLSELDRAGRRRFRRAVQIVFQDPYASLNPRLTVGAAIREVCVVHGVPRPRERTSELLERVGLDAAMAGRYPHEFSGGQRQRLGIARALAVGPSVLVADEPVSALDVSVQAKILGLMLGLQRDLGLAYLFISHDLAVIRVVAHRVAVMRAGKIVEEGAAGRILERPGHEYTKALLAAAPTLPATA